MMYLVGFKNPECDYYIKINDPELYLEVERAVKKTPIDGTTAFLITDKLKKGGFEFGKDYWMKKLPIKDMKGFVFKVVLLHKDCFKEIEQHLGFSLANSIDNDTYFNGQDAGDIVNLLDQFKFKENKHYKIEYFSETDIAPGILIGIKISSLNRKIEEYYQDGDCAYFEKTYPSVFNEIQSFDMLNRLPTNEEIKIHERKWKGFFERQGRIKDGLW